MSTDRETEEFLLFAASPARAGAFWYVPKHAGVERSHDGRPQLLLLAAGLGGHLMLTTRWGATEAELKKLEIELVEAGVALPGALQLSPAPLAVTGCRLLLGPDPEHVETLAFNKTSGHGSFSALFSQQLDAQRFQIAASALRGGAAVLAVEYEATLKRSSTTRASFRVVSDSLCVPRHRGQRQIPDLPARSQQLG